MENTRTQWGATIQESEASESISLHLYVSAMDGRYRWYQDENGADSEVSGATEDEAIEAARAAWGSWNIHIWDMEEGK
jgi:hypothetical protein